jgi:hypothetical protein
MLKPGTRSALGTAFLVLAILVLGGLIVAQQHREVRLRAALAQFQGRTHEKIHSRLNSPIFLQGGAAAIPLNWGGTESLDVVLGKLTQSTARLAGRPRSFAVVVDPHGLEEAGLALQATVQLPRVPKGELTFSDLLQQILEPNGLAWKVEEGTLTFTSRKALERLNASIRKRLDQPIFLHWSNGDSLYDVIERVRVSTEGLSFRSGLPIVVQARVSDSRDDFRILADGVGRELPIGEQLRRLLEPLGLQYEVKNGAVLIVAENVPDESS